MTPSRTVENRSIGKSVGIDARAPGAEVEPPELADARLLPLLKQVSRSFYLTIRVLPGEVSSQIALAYLLARATDTIADSTQPSVALRMEALRELAAAIQGTAPKESVDELRKSFARQQDDDHRSDERVPETAAADGTGRRRRRHYGPPLATAFTCCGSVESSTCNFGKPSI